jgi:hypothetical protein
MAISTQQTVAFRVVFDIVIAVKPPSSSTLSPSTVAGYVGRSDVGEL